MNIPVIYFSLSLCLPLFRAVWGFPVSRSWFSAGRRCQVPHIDLKAASARPKAKKSTPVSLGVPVGQTALFRAVVWMTKSISIVRESFV